MKNIKKVLSLLLTLAMLVSVPVVAFAEEIAASELFGEEVLHSITTEEKTGKGLAFLFTANVSGATMSARHVADYTNAVATVNGVEYQVQSMGAVLANQPGDIANIKNITREDVDEQYILDVEAKKLNEANEDSCSFVVRIINLPPMALGRAIAARPYIVLKDADGNESTVYGGDDISTYNKEYYKKAQEETPVLDVSSLVTVITKDRLSVTAASAEYVAYETENYVEAFKVSLTLSNISANAKTSAGDYVEYACYDKDGNVLHTEKVVVDGLTAGATQNVEFYAPIGTASIEMADSDLTYVPDITLPAIGSDIDVSKKKNRIHVSAASASFNEDGTIHVELTFKNNTDNWITEETDYVRYGWYKGSTRKGLDYIYIGVIDTKKNPVKTFEFDVPYYTTEVRFVSSKIVYWTEWA